MATYEASYSPDDNKLRLRASARLDADTYARVKAAGFIWAPKQDLFVAPMWTPSRADLLMELAGDIGDEDTSLTDRAEERADRFETYREHRTADAESARRAVDALADGIPLGQPILVGHHSERHARRDAERIESGIRKAIRMWDTAQYWKARAAGAIRHAKYKERPDVRQRRIKKIEADRRLEQRIIDRARHSLALWAKLDADAKDGSACTPALRRTRAITIANVDGGYYRARYTFASGYEGPLSLWEAAGGNTHGHDPESVALASPDEIREQAQRNHEATIRQAQRWIDHYDLRLEYERAMLADAGGTIAQRTGPEKGGACRCWATARGRGRWSLIQKVNRVSVTVLDNWGNGGPDFTRTIPFDQLLAVMSRADVNAAREAGRIAGETPRGFVLLDTQPPRPEPTSDTDAPRVEAEQDHDHRPTDTPAPASPSTAGDFDAMRATLRAGVQVIAVPQLFPTPADLARTMITLAEIQPGNRVLEPSAGTGVLLGAMGGQMFGADVKYGRVHAVEIHGALCPRLRADFPLTVIHQGDFLTMTADDFGGHFDRIVMNPPFRNGEDIKHIQHAASMLAAGGRLVAICADGPRQRDRLGPMVDMWIDVPAGTFAAAATNVRAALIVINAESLAARLPDVRESAHDRAHG
jgi:phospholipid N-methyltransferase